MSALSGTSPPEPRLFLRTDGTVETYRAALPDGRDVVVKRLVPERAAADPVGARRFGREKRLAEVLRHPSLPCLIATGDGWMASERLEGCLLDSSRRGNLTVAGSVALLGALAGVLAHVHALGVVHRDIKPGHVMFRGKLPVLIDFGIAGLRCEDDPLAGSEFSGSPAWMAPEQIAGDPGGPEADTWALCALGLWLLTGVRPYFGPAQEVLARRRAGEQPRFEWERACEAAPRGLVELLRAGLGEAATRPTSAELSRLLAVRRSPVPEPDAVS